MSSTCVRTAAFYLVVSWWCADLWRSRTGRALGPSKGTASAFEVGEFYICRTCRITTRGASDRLGERRLLRHPVVAGTACARPYEMPPEVWQRGHSRVNAPESVPPEVS